LTPCDAPCSRWWWRVPPRGARRPNAVDLEAQCSPAQCLAIGSEVGKPMEAILVHRHGEHHRQLAVLLHSLVVVHRHPTSSARLTGTLPRLNLRVRAGRLAGGCRPAAAQVAHQLPAATQAVNQLQAPAVHTVLRRTEVRRTRMVVLSRAATVRTAAIPMAHPLTAHTELQEATEERMGAPTGTARRHLRRRT